MSTVDPAVNACPTTSTSVRSFRTPQQQQQPPQPPQPQKQQRKSQTPPKPPKPPSQQKHQKRTNSLGWASSDCHRCRAERWTCDRTRPRCDACTAHGVVCDGYVLNLNWQKGIASRGRWKGRQLHAETSFPASSQQQQARTDVATPGAFLFMYEHGHGQGERISASRRRARTRQTQQQKPRQQQQEQRRRQRKQQQQQQKRCATTTAPDEEQTHKDDRPSSELVKHTASHHRRREQGASAAQISPSSSTELLRPMATLYPVSPHVGELLVFYEWQFARTTITCDVKINPWQCSLPMVFKIHFLMCAVTALSRLHRSHCLNNDGEDPEALDLKKHALSSFRSGVTQKPAVPTEALIATTLTLIGIEYADTAFSNWSVHLGGAYNILETANGLDRAAFNSTLRCQIAMLLWYDITAALLSRAGPVFPQHYLDTVLSWSAQYPGEWSYMSLNGCPDSLLPDMYHLAASAPSAARMRPVDLWRLERSVMGMDAETGLDVNAEPSPPPPLPPPDFFSVNVENGDDIDINVDNDTASTGHSRSYMSPGLYPSASVKKPTNAMARMTAPSDRSANLIKCWRLSMLLYLRQVFYLQTGCADEDQRQEEQRRALSRSIIGLISEMPTESNWQKQCLLPVVLAGFELRRVVTPDHTSSVACGSGGSLGSDVPPGQGGGGGAASYSDTLSLRRWVASYCQRWKTLTGLWVFGTAGELLNRLWDRMDFTSAVSPLSAVGASAYHHQRHQSSSIPSQQQRQYGEKHAQPVWWGDIVAEDIRASEVPSNREYMFGCRPNKGPVNAGYLFG